MNTLPTHYREEDKDEIDLLFNMMIDPGLDFVRKKA